MADTLPLRQTDAPPGDLAAKPESVPIHDRLAWDLADIANLLGMSKRFLERERAAGKIPPPDIRLGRRLLWRPATINRWLDSQGGGRR